MNNYYLWTIGCQMNTADSERLGAALEQMGIQPVEKAAEADVIVLNSCVVRQGAEDKVASNLAWMAPLKKDKPERIIALMGCMVGPKTDALSKRFPYVDVFMRPQQFDPLLEIVGERTGVDWEGCVGPLTPVRPDITCHVPIIHGCDLMCTFCIIPYRRGRQVSRSIAEIALEVETLVSKGVKEVTLLGQTVDAYGYDLPDKPNLADLFARLDQIDGIERIRFLTSHPKFMTQEIIQAVADVPKVCEHINLPVQAGDDEILDEMRRQYSRQDYIDLVGRIREAMPEVALNTDIIVGFPGETEEQFQQTLDLLAVLKLDKVHCAAYSTRPGTIASRSMSDTVPEAEKTKRRQRVDLQQEQIQTEINAKLVGQYVEILVEGRQRGKWQGRTRSHKLVFFEDEAYHLGNLVQVKIDRSSPWSLQGTLSVKAKLLNPISSGTNRGED